MNQAKQTVLPPQITVENANAVYQQLQQFIQGENGDASVDLASVSHCDSAGVSMLIEIKSEQLARGHQVEYHNPSVQLRDLARFLKVEELLFSA